MLGSSCGISRFGSAPEHDARCRHIANRHKFLAPLHPQG
jgi:hypothetical protein